MKRIRTKVGLLVVGIVGTAAAFSAGLMDYSGRDDIQRQPGAEHRNGWNLSSRDDGLRVFMPVEAGAPAHRDSAADELLALTVSPGWQADVLEDGSLLVYEGLPGDASPGDESIPGSRVIRFRRDGSLTLAPARRQIAALD